MRSALENSWLQSEIYNQINLNDGNDSHPMAGLLAWKMVAEMQYASAGDEMTCGERTIPIPCGKTSGGRKDACVDVSII